VFLFQGKTYKNVHLLLTKLTSHCQLNRQKQLCTKIHEFIRWSYWVTTFTTLCKSINWPNTGLMPFSNQEVCTKIRNDQPRTAVKLIQCKS